MTPKTQTLKHLSGKPTTPRNGIIMLNTKDAAQLKTLDNLIGEKLFIRTVTNYWTGEFVGITGGFIELNDAAWIANTGRFSDAIKTGALVEVDPVGRAWVGVGAIVDFTTWNHPLPMKQTP